MKTSYILDVDGTFANCYYSLKEAAAHVRAQIEAPSTPEGKGSAISRYKKMWPLSDAKPTDPVLAKHRREMLEAADLVPEIQETACSLYHQGTALALVSNQRAKVVSRLLRDLAMDIFFEFIYGADVVGAPGPDPAMIHQAMTDLRVRREEVLLVGDSVMDIDMARAAGIRVALVTSANTRSHCASGGPDYVLDAWPQLLGLKL